jgi:hypothetical protein
MRKQRKILYAALAMPTAFSNASVRSLFPSYWYDPVKSSSTLPVSRKLFTGRDIVDLFGRKKLGIVCLNIFWNVMKARIARQFSSLNSLCTCEKHIFALDSLNTANDLARTGYNVM